MITQLWLLMQQIKFTGLDSTIMLIVSHKVIIDIIIIDRSS